MGDYEGETPTDKFLETTLQGYSDGDREFEKDLIDSYKISVEEHLGKLAVAFEIHNMDDAILYSHDIKGSSSYIGAEAVRWVSGKMETLCKQGKLEAASVHLAELSEEVTAVFKLLDKYINPESTTEDNKEEVKDGKKETKEEKKPAKD